MLESDKHLERFFSPTFLVYEMKNAGSLVQTSQNDLLKRGPPTTCTTEVVDVNLTHNEHELFDW